MHSLMLLNSTHEQLSKCWHSVIVEGPGYVWKAQPGLKVDRPFSFRATFQRAEKFLLLEVYSKKMNI